MRNPLDKILRKQLERAVEKARDTAELAAKEELQRLAVDEKVAAGYLTEEQRDLRNRLRAHSRFLGDALKVTGEQDVDLLVTEIAYEHWHRMLFSRFLAENDLLMYEDGVTPLAISDCFDLAEEETGDSSNGWRYAANYAAKMLPQIFRNNSPVYEIEFSPNHQKKLEKLLEDLDEATFQSQDALGWLYQFWQSKRKAEVNASEVKIGAKELSPVTQLFTEPYMVSFLLDNALGAWWANQQLTDADYATAQSEDELRAKAAIEGVPLSYLRFVKTYTAEQQALIDSVDAPKEKPDPEGLWEPAAGKFEQWPSELCDFKTLDPCCGSGHFLVAILLMLVPIRMQRENLTEQQAIAAVLSQNVHGLELDQRCVEIAVFALALEAWRYPNSGGYRQLPELHLACSGLSVKAAKDEWKQLGLGKRNLTIALDWMHQEFSDAPVLGSLINPRKSNAAKIVQWDELESVLNQAISGDSNQQGNESIEAGIVAQGMAKAATLLAAQYDWVVTNVPYLKAGDQCQTLKDFCIDNYPDAKYALETSFIERCHEFLKEDGVCGLVTQQYWLFLKYYDSLREKYIRTKNLGFIARLGPGAFGSIGGEVVNVCLQITMNDKAIRHRGIDVDNYKGVDLKQDALCVAPICTAKQKSQLKNPDCRISFEIDNSFGKPLSEVCDFGKGSVSGDGFHYLRKIWEFPNKPDYSKMWLNSPEHEVFWSGRQELILWDNGFFNPESEIGFACRGQRVFGKEGIAIGKAGKFRFTPYSGELFDDNVAVIKPYNNENIPLLWEYCTSGALQKDIKKLDKKMSVTAGTFTKVRLESSVWLAESHKKLPVGLPRPFTNDPTQWVFHGHPCGSVIWHEQNKCTANTKLRIDHTVLQVAIARLIGYQWPTELDSMMELAVEQREWVDKTKVLHSFVDDDGIVCLPAVRGEKSAEHRLEELLQASYGDTWSVQIRSQLLESADCKNKTLDAWLREKFFEQHSKLFQHRPFIWHIWDGLKDGFSALVNYHQLDKKNLERLIYTYLDDWIRTQSHQQADGVDGASERLVAANNLKERLELILEGEAPYDIFVRWKPLEEQSVGWKPDLNDGVRLNIRPFTTAGVLRHNKKPKLNIHWSKDRGKDVESAPWYDLGLDYGGKEGDRINDHHLSLAEKIASKK